MATCCNAARSSTVLELLLLLSLQCCLSLGKSESILIIALPQRDAELSASWERGEEVLPGAKQAIEEARNGSLSFNITLIEVTSSPVTRYNRPYSGDVLEIIANLTWQKRASDIIGIAGVLHPNILASLNRFQLPIVSLIQFSNTPQNSNVHYSTASIWTLTDSILAFFNKIRSRRIGLVTEMNQPYYLTVSNELRTKANISLDIQINKHGQSLSSIAEKIFESNVHVILLSVGPSTAVPMLCEAYKRGLTWPKYTWILHSYRLEDLLQSSESNKECSVEKTLEGITIFQLTKETNVSISKTVHHNRSGDGFNPYADLLYNSVSTLISSTDNMPFANLNPDKSKVYIYHNLNDMANLTGIYDGTSLTLTNVSEITFTDYDLPTVTKGLLPPYLLSLPILSFLFNTILLVLYIVYRNEPDIKSTSVSLSMLMFTGCYLLIVFIICDVLFEQYRVGLCILRIWLSAAGLSLPLITTTLLIKMLRVYHIFTTLKLLKQSIKCKDYTLVVYIVLILLPLITLLTLRSVIRPSYKVEIFIEHPGFIEIEQSCDGEYSFIWYTFTEVYGCILSAVTVIIAVKSRKIRHAHFKDTKSVNLLTFLILIIVTGFFSYTYTFYFIDPLGFLVKLVIYVSHMLIVTACQTTLFVPRIWSLVRKKFNLQTPKTLQNGCNQINKLVSCTC